MPLDLTRAQRRFLGLSAPFLPRSDEALVPLERLILHPDASRTLRDLLLTPGNLVGGPLYGHATDGVLHVRLAALAGYAWWLPPGDPLALDPKYILGYGDAVQLLSGGQLTWIGHWLVLPLRQLPDAREQLGWQEQALHAGLLDLHHPLLMPGWHDEVLEAVAVRAAPQGQWRQLAVEFSTASST